MSIHCDIEGFKKLVGEFCKSASAAEIDSLDNGFKCVGLAYLNIDPLPEGANQIIAVSYFDYAGRRYHERERELILGASE